METANFRKTLIDIAQKDSAERVLSKVIAFYYPTNSTSDSRPSRRPRIYR